MKEKNIKNEMEYTLIGGYYIPNIKIGLKGFKEESKLGKYARLRMEYLKSYQKSTYQMMVMNGTLYIHLQDVQNMAQSRVEELVKKFAKQENVNEDLKRELYCKNNEYRKVYDKIEKIKCKYPKIRGILEDEQVYELTLGESQALLRAINLMRELLRIEQYEIFFLRGRENYEYMKKLKIL